MYSLNIALTIRVSLALFRQKTFLFCCVIAKGSVVAYAPVNRGPLILRLFTS